MIQIQHLTKRFDTASGTLVALNDINLEIADGDIYGIIGMSGAGKSTLVRCINMLERPDEGNVEVNGRRMQDLKPAELQTAILIPKEAYDNYHGFYIKYGMRNAMEIATTGCSVNVKLNDDKTVIEDIRIGYGVAGPVPLRARHAEAVGRGLTVSPESIRAISEAISEDVRPRDSWRASKAFREHLCHVMCERAAEAAIRRAGGEL